MILLDTVVLSELRKRKPNAYVLNYLASQSPETVFLSALTIGEIEAGIERQRRHDAQFAADLEQWLVKLEVQFADCILPVTSAIAKLWGRLCVQSDNKGVDNLIAATALCHNLTVVTRNVKHFEPTGVRVINPFDRSDR